MSVVKKILAGSCENCPLCKYARKKPDTWFGKLMAWHGKWCPAWKSRKELYGSKPGNEVGKENLVNN